MGSVSEMQRNKVKEIQRERDGVKEMPTERKICGRDAPIERKIWDADALRETKSEMG